MDVLSTINPQAPGFVAGVIICLAIVGLFRLIKERKVLLARVEAAEAKLQVLGTEVVTEVEAGAAEVSKDAKAVAQVVDKDLVDPIEAEVSKLAAPIVAEFQKLMADVKAERASIAAAQASPKS